MFQGGLLILLSNCIHMKYIKKIVLVVIVIFAIIVIAGMYKFNYLANQPGYDVDGNKISEMVEKIPVESENMTIKIPSWDLSGEIAYTEYTVPKTAGVLNTTYKKMFELQGSDGYEGLSYESVIINDGVAAVDLSGIFFPAGDFSGAYLRNNINAAAFQFESVDSIVVYVNGEIFDWCVEDMSGGEGGCPQIPMYWNDMKKG